MRLNRRKNRGSRDRRKRPIEPDRTSPPESPEGSGDERRRGLARAVQSVRAGDGRMRPARPDAGTKPRTGGDARNDAFLHAARSVAADVVGVAREILRWPARIWMTVAEALGGAILEVWRRAVLPAAKIAWRALRVALAWGERTVTPARGLAVVAVAAAVAMGGSQFGDYRAVEVGTPQYAKVETVAPAPQVERAKPNSAHGVSVFAIAVACLFVVLFAVWRNWRLARLLLFGGVAVIAISLFVDRPDGLRLGTAGEAYSGAHALLLGPFWVQLFAGATLVVVGPLLAVQLRGERAVRRRHAAGRRGGEAKPRRTPRLRPGVGT